MNSANQKQIESARNRVRDKFGGDFASKASTACALAFGKGASFEASGRRTTIVELVPSTSTLPARLNAAQDETGWEEIYRTVQDAMSDDVLVASVLKALRQARVTAAKEAFYTSVGSVRSELEKEKVIISPSAKVLSANPVRQVLTELCWINETVRTKSKPETLAEIAQDPSIARIDFPRRLKADIGRGAITVGAPTYRQKVGSTGKGVIVAVVDSEVFLAHPALHGRLVHRHNYTTEPWGHPGAHGTAVAGIIAGNGPNLSGIAPEATIYNYKVLSEDEALNSDDFYGAVAIQQALEDGVQIANCSWGAGPAGNGTSREARACNAAWRLGLTVVKSAGNEGPDLHTLTTPADADGVIVVGATSYDGGTVQDYSSRGPRWDGQARPHLVAPGGSPGDDIISFSVDGQTAPCGHGTSFAAPVVAGLTALILEKESNLKPDELRAKLLSTCRRLATGTPNDFGEGLVYLG